MKARDVMTPNVITVTPETSVKDAAQLMLDRQISGLPVITDAGELVGMITEGDLMRRAELVTARRPWWLASASSPEQQAEAYIKAHSLKAEDVMTRDVVTIDEHDPLDRIAMIFEKSRIKRAPVVNGDRVIGIVSRANLLRGLVAAKTGDADPGDKAIRSEILERVREDAGVRDSLLDVTVAKGVVYLWGNVASEAEREAVRVVAETTEGVRKVQNHIRLIPPSIVSWKPE